MGFARQVMIEFGNRKYRKCAPVESRCNEKCTQDKFIHWICTLKKGHKGMHMGHAYFDVERENNPINLIFSELGEFEFLVDEAVKKRKVNKKCNALNMV